MMENELIKEQTTTNNIETKFEEVQPKAQKPEQTKIQSTDSYFDGGLLDLIGWKLLAILITILTFGIGASWGQCMLYSYQIKHTVYNGKRLKFTGTGGELFVNYFKWTFLTIITLGIYAFFIPIKKTRWVVSNICFKDEGENENECYFDGKTIQLIGVNLLCFLLNLISFGLLSAFTTCYKLRWINKHTIINRKRLVFDGKAICLFGKYILWTFLTLITFGIYGLWLDIKMLKWQTKNTHIKSVGEIEKKDRSFIYAIPIAIIGIAVATVVIMNCNIIFENMGLKLNGEYNSLNSYDNSSKSREYTSNGYQYTLHTIK